MNLLIIDGYTYKLIETDKPKFVLKSEVNEATNSIKTAMDGQNQVVGFSVPFPMDSLKIGGKLYGYFPVNITDGLMEKMKAKLAELKGDERMYYQSATVFSNAPLALIQMGMSAQINLLEEMLGIEISSFPLKK